MDIGTFQQDKCQLRCADPKWRPCISLYGDCKYFYKWVQGSLVHIILLRCGLQNIDYYRVTKFRFKIIRAERLTRTRSTSSSSTTSRKPRSARSMVVAIRRSSAVTETLTRIMEVLTVPSATFLYVITFILH